MNSTIDNENCYPGNLSKHKSFDKTIIRRNEAQKQQCFSSKNGTNGYNDSDGCMKRSEDYCCHPCTLDIDDSMTYSCGMGHSGFSQLDSPIDLNLNLNLIGSRVMVNNINNSCNVNRIDNGDYHNDSVIAKGHEVSQAATTSHVTNSNDSNLPNISYVSHSSHLSHVSNVSCVSEQSSKRFTQNFNDLQNIQSLHNHNNEHLLHLSHLSHLSQSSNFTFPFNNEETGPSILMRNTIATIPPNVEIIGHHNTRTNGGSDKNKDCITNTKKNINITREKEKHGQHDHQQEIQDMDELEHLHSYGMIRFDFVDTDSDNFTFENWGMLPNLPNEQTPPMLSVPLALATDGEDMDDNSLDNLTLSNANTTGRSLSPSPSVSSFSIASDYYYDTGISSVTTVSSYHPMDLAFDLHPNHPNNDTDCTNNGCGQLCLVPPTLTKKQQQQQQEQEPEEWGINATTTTPTTTERKVTVTSTSVSTNTGKITKNTTGNTNMKTEEKNEKMEEGCNQSRDKMKEKTNGKAVNVRGRWDTLCDDIVVNIASFLSMDQFLPNFLYVRRTRSTTSRNRMNLMIDDDTPCGLASMSDSALFNMFNCPLKSIDGGFESRSCHGFHTTVNRGIASGRKSESSEIEDLAVFDSQLQDMNDLDTDLGLEDELIEYQSDSSEIDIDNDNVSDCDIRQQSQSQPQHQQQPKRSMMLPRLSCQHNQASASDTREADDELSVLTPIHTYESDDSSDDIDYINDIDDINAIGIDPIGPIDPINDIDDDNDNSGLNENCMTFLVLSCSTTDDDTDEASSADGLRRLRLQRSPRSPSRSPGGLRGLPHYTNEKTSVRNDSDNNNNNNNNKRNNEIKSEKNNIANNVDMSNVCKNWKNALSNKKQNKKLWHQLFVNQLSCCEINWYNKKKLGLKDIYYERDMMFKDKNFGIKYIWKRIYNKIQDERKNSLDIYDKNHGSGNDYGLSDKIVSKIENIIENFDNDSNNVDLFVDFLYFYKYNVLLKHSEMIIFMLETIVLLEYRGVLRWLLIILDECGLYSQRLKNGESGKHRSKIGPLYQRSEFDYIMSEILTPPSADDDNSRRLHVKYSFSLANDGLTRDIRYIWENGESSINSIRPLKLMRNVDLNYSFIREKFSQNQHRWNPYQWKNIREFY